MYKGLGARHRRKRHHEAGIEQAIQLFGEEAGNAARQHIISDLKEEGWTRATRFLRMRNTISEWACSKNVQL